jgi:hypothetical protein
MACPGTEPDPPRWEAGDYTPELRHGRYEAKTLKLNQPTRCLICYLIIVNQLISTLKGVCCDNAYDFHYEVYVSNLVDTGDNNLNNA